MNDGEVRRIVESAIGGDWSRTNAHGCDLKRCLVDPRVQEFENHGGPGASGFIKLWVVLEECPETQDGYQIVFDETRQMFGLALLGNDGPVYLGPYGGFMDAFDAM
jgi:hypothetical protein